jgi:hypothetical protein
MTLQRLSRARRPTVNPPCNASSIHTHIDHEIQKMRNIYGKCKSSRKIDGNLLWLDYNHYSNDAAEALTSQAPDGKSTVHASSVHTHFGVFIGDVAED